MRYHDSIFLLIRDMLAIHDRADFAQLSQNLAKIPRSKQGNHFLQQTVIAPPQKQDPSYSVYSPEANNYDNYGSNQDYGLDYSGGHNVDILLGSPYDNISNFSNVDQEKAVK